MKCAIYKMRWKTEVKKEQGKQHVPVKCSLQYAVLGIGVPGKRNEIRELSNSLKNVCNKEVPDCRLNV